MVGIIDIAPLVESVDVRGNTVVVRGLEIETIGELLWQFPEIRKMWETRQFDRSALLKLSKSASAAIVVACVEDIDVQGATNLSLGERVEIIAKIVRITMPRGLGPFVELMEAIGLGEIVALSASAQGTKSQKRSKP